MKKLFYTFGICIALSAGCSNRNDNVNALFSEAHPIGGRGLKVFPARLRSQYISIRDSSKLTIRHDGIYLDEYQDVKSHVSEQTKLRLYVDSFYTKGGRTELLPLRRIGDTLHFRLHRSDTMFCIDEDHILNRVKKSYILNSRQEEGWACSRLRLDGNVLTISYLGEEEIEQLKKIANEHLDSFPYRFRISAANFKKFIKEDGFKDVDTFKLDKRRRRIFMSRIK